MEFFRETKKFARFEVRHAIEFGILLAFFVVSPSRRKFNSDPTVLKQVIYKVNAENSQKRIVHYREFHKKNGSRCLNRR